MDAYCPRCQDAIVGIDTALLERGKCPACGGQINVGGVTSDLAVNGAIAMSFAAGSRVAVPLEASFAETELDLDRRTEDTEPRGRLPPPPPADATSGAPGGAPGAETDGGAATISGLDAGALAATIVVPQSSHEQETVLAPPPDDNEKVEDHPVDAEEGQPESTESTEDLSPDLTAKTSGDLADPGTVSPTGELAGESESSLGHEPAGPAPTGAHLKLPSIDFSMPDFGAPPSSSDEAPPPPVSGELPAHLQLPNFPDFELPPIPGEEKPRITGDIAIEAAVGGSFAADGSASVPPLPLEGESTPVDGVPPGAENWSVADATQPSVPPPLPAPPPLPPNQQQQPQPPQQVQDGLPALPGGFGLPSLGPTDTGAPQEPTLVQSDVAARVAQAERKSRMPILIVGVLLLLLAGIGGTVAYYGPSTVASWFGGKPDAEVVVTKRDRAEEHNFVGEQAYREGEAAEKANKKREAQGKYRVAITRFKKALTADRTFAKAHRNLAIALAKANKQAEAVEQYRAYLRKAPDAADKKEVHKIINDWEASQDKKKKKKR